MRTYDGYLHSCRCDALELPGLYWAVPAKNAGIARHRQLRPWQLADRQIVITPLR